MFPLTELLIGQQKSRKIIRAANGIASAEDTAMQPSEHYQRISCTISNSTLVTCATSLFTLLEEGFERGQQQDLVLAFLLGEQQTCNVQFYEHDGSIMAPALNNV